MDKEQELDVLLRKSMRAQDRLSFVDRQNPVHNTRWIIIPGVAEGGQWRCDRQKKKKRLQQ